MNLYFKKIGNGPPIFILHGVFGSGDNWLSLAKSLERHTCYLIDQRNHGQSPHSDSLNYEVMAEDLNDLMEAEGLESVVVMGHSMGGKVAMTFGAKYPHRVDRLIVVDIAPRHYPPHHSDIFDAFASVDVRNLQSRKEAEQQMAKQIHDEGVRLFILKNLQRTREGFSWKLNLKAIKENANAIGAALPDDYSFEGPTLFIGGEKSAYILEEDQVDIQHHFPHAQVVHLKDAGHWVHADQPDALRQLIDKFLSQ